MRRILSIPLAALLLLCSVSLGQAGSITVLDPSSTVAGKTIGQWTEAWWNWKGMSSAPFVDQTGAAANDNQSGPVFFLAGLSGTSTSATRSFHVPDGKYVLVPLLNAIAYNVTSPQTKASNNLNSLFDLYDISAVLDGTPLSITDPLDPHRASASPFTLTLLSGNPIGSAGSYSNAASDGYWLMLAPLSEGKHTVVFSATLKADASISLPSITITDNITVAPEPASLTLFGLGFAGMFGYGLRRRSRKGY